ncbi:hypothetical protein PUN28_011516 [Cardiocondyla obscurior]|uniref:Uncharacterized protein n=1 Tax=Cardiocondyla obscurior TaxID=286306 RepID=A0AAW2FJR3_9HYME
MRRPPAAPYTHSGEEVIPRSARPSRSTVETSSRGPRRRHRFPRAPPSPPPPPPPTTASPRPSSGRSHALFLSSPGSLLNPRFVSRSPGVRETLPSPSTSPLTLWRGSRWAPSWTERVDFRHAHLDSCSAREFDLIDNEIHSLNAGRSREMQIKVTFEKSKTAW